MIIGRGGKTTGFTIVEALVTLAVGSAILLLALAVSIAANRSFRVAVAQRNAALTAERALAILVREVRSAQVGTDGSHPIIAANDQELIILSDVDGDMVAEWIRYALVATTSPEGGRMERSVAEANGDPPRYDPDAAVTTVIARGIRNGSQPVFSYYDAAYTGDVAKNPLPSSSRLSDTRYIRLELMVNLDPLATATTAIASGVSIRNLRERQ